MTQVLPYYAIQFPQGQVILPTSKPYQYTHCPYIPYQPYPPAEVTLIGTHELNIIPHRRSPPTERQAPTTPPMSARTQSRVAMTDESRSTPEVSGFDDILSLPSSDSGELLSMTETSVADNRHDCKDGLTVGRMTSWRGRAVVMSLCAGGSSLIQAALQKFPHEAVALFAAELLSPDVIPQTITDKNACYTVKTLMSMLGPKHPLVYPVLQVISQNTQLLVTMCNKDLHCRRTIQFLLEFDTAESLVFTSLYRLLLTRPLDIVRSSQGCITAQRILDRATTSEKEAFFQLIRHPANLSSFATDPFAHFVVEYMMVEGDKPQNSLAILECWRGQFLPMAMHHTAFTVLEKSFNCITQETKRRIFDELFVRATIDQRLQLISHPKGVFVVQAAIDSSTQRDIALIQHQIGGLLSEARGPAKKILAKLNRRSTMVDPHAHART